MRKTLCIALFLAAFAPGLLYASKGIERIELRVEGMT
jgi:hypothetical protein